MASTNIQKRYCSIQELSIYTSLPTGTLYEWASLRVIPSIKIGKRVLFDLQDIDAVMTSFKRSPEDVTEAVSKLGEHL